MGLEEAREKINNMDSQQNETSENVNSQSADESKTVEQKLVDLAALDKFTFEGKEWTLKDLKNSILMHQDYTRKTQTLAQERQRLEESSKFDLNLRHDLANVAANPALAAEFKKIYPKEYHNYLSWVMKEAQQNESEQQQPAIPKEFTSRIESIESKLFEKEVEAESARIDSIIEKFSKQYDMADVDLVLSRAEALSNKGTKLDEKTWEQLFKSTHDALESKFKDKYSKRAKEQQEASSKAKDTRPGGGVPGQSPVVPKNLREAREHMIASLTGKQQ